MSVAALGDICRTTSGGTPSRKRSDFFVGSIPWVKSGELTDGLVSEVEEFITEDAISSSSAKVFPAGTLLIALYGATVGKLGILSRAAATNQAVCAIFPPSDLDTKFLFWNLRLRRSDLIARAVGGAQPNISQTILRNLEIDIPPLEEQREIVGEIEKQFSRLDEAVAGLKRVKANLKRHKAAVLKSAVEGRLVPTEAELARREDRNYETGAQLLQRILATRRSQWQGKGKYKEPAVPDTTNLPELPEGWVWAELIQLADKITDGTHHTPTYLPQGIAFLSVKDIRDDTLHFDDSKFISQAEHDELSKRCNPERGDVLITKSGTIGRTAIVKTTQPFSLFVSVALIKPVKPQAQPRYLQIALDAYIQSIDIAQDVKGGLLKNLHLEDLRQLPIQIPPEVEQHRIVAEVDRRLSIVREVEAEVEANLKRAQGLRQAILSKAFCGAPQ